MTRKSKRELERDLDDLEPDHDDDMVPVVFSFTSFGSSDLADSPHPELTVETWPDSDRHDNLSIALPNLWPERYAGEPSVLVESCKNDITETWPEDPEESDNRVLACELWDALTDEDLREEYRIREENGEQIPPILEEYAPKE